MVRTEANILISRPVEEVWEYFLNTENIPYWALNFKEARFITEGPIHIGTQCYWKNTFLGKDISSTYEVYEFEPYKVIAYKSISGPFPMTFRYTFQPRMNGTFLTVYAEGEPGGFFKFAEPLLTSFVTRYFQHSFENLKELVEVEALVPA